LGDEGFSLIEIMVVIAIISIMTFVALPQMSGFLSNNKKDFALFTGMIAKTFDDAFLNDRVDYLVVHLYTPGENNSSEDDNTNNLFGHNNGISVVNLKKGVFQKNPKKILRYRGFKDNFKIESVLFPNGKKISEGNVLLPFLPGGYSSDVIIHILVDDEDRYSVKISKHFKEPEVREGFVDFEE